MILMRHFHFQSYNFNQKKEEEKTTKKEREREVNPPETKREIYYDESTIPACIIVVHSCARCLIPRCNPSTYTSLRLPHLPVYRFVTAIIESPYCNCTLRH